MNLNLRLALSHFVEWTESYHEARLKKRSRRITSYVFTCKKGLSHWVFLMGFQDWLGTPGAHLTGANVEALVATWEASLRGGWPKNGKLIYLDDVKP